DFEVAKWATNLASSIDPSECGICLQKYNTTHRPRTLQCGHNFCGTCLQNCIHQGIDKCSVCRRPLTATTIDEIPINTDFEQLIQMWTPRAVNTNDNEPSDEEGDFSKGRCSKHPKSFLYFKCKTHDLYICRECSVIQHPSSRCNIVEIKEEVMKTKEDTLKETGKNIDSLSSATTKLETFIVDRKATLASKESKIQSLLKEIDEDCKFIDQAQEDIAENKSITKQLQECTVRLQKSTANKEINNECSELQGKNRELQRIVVEQREKY
ncbi:unnamed protein product, partial [Meganyctiphanes norvegica]